jgi:hypothetical protein
MSFTNRNLRKYVVYEPEPSASLESIFVLFSEPEPLNLRKFGRFRIGTLESIICRFRTGTYAVYEPEPSQRAVFEPERRVD